MQNGDTIVVEDEDDETEIDSSLNEVKESLPLRESTQNAIDPFYAYLLQTNSKHIYWKNILIYT